jgi:hypothetical protein
MICDLDGGGPAVKQSDKSNKKLYGLIQISTHATKLGEVLDSLRPVKAGLIKG